MFENYIISEIYKKELHLARDSELFYFGTQDKAEIDLIVDRKNKREMIEIKKSGTLKPNQLRTLKTYRGKTDQCFLIYQGRRDVIDDIKILPCEEYLMNSS